MYTNAIITFSKNRYLLTRDENARLRSVGLDDWFKMDNGTLIRGNTIGEILTIQDYYSKYPDERPNEIKEFHAEPRETYKSMENTAEFDKRASFGLLKGLKRFCKENSNAKNAKSLFRTLLNVPKTRCTTCNTP